TKLIDVVMIQSLFQLENVGSFLTEYDMMLVDECHHVTALQFEKVVAQFAGPYLYGLTATPERKNGHEPIVYQRIGDILHTAQSHQVSFRKELSLRLTSFGKMEVEKVKSSSFTNLSEWLSKDHFRNQQICQD
ncbi:DEAD/DEAH box helicase, partial [Streptococcus pyogenes]